MIHVAKSKTMLAAAALSLVFWATKAMAAGNCTPSMMMMTNMTFQLDWKYNAQFSGVFLADHMGYFKEAGVDMTIKQWEDGVNVVLDVAEGRADFACVEQNLIIAAQAEGLPVRAVATSK
jgi:ABC-type nitrate/sulfonate/bicarbonate transport system substrate-binding protein